MKYRKRPIVVDAVQWFKDGDHAKVSPLVKAESRMSCCDSLSTQHGIVYTIDGNGIVCPGDWIIEGKIYPCKPDIFAKTYEPVGGDQSHEV